MAKVKLECGVCGGSGNRPRSEPETVRQWLNVFPMICDPCNGTGVVWSNVNPEEWKPAQPPDASGD